MKKKPSSWGPSPYQSIHRFFNVKFDAITPGTMEASHQAFRGVFKDLQLERELAMLQQIHWKPIPLREDMTIRKALLAHRGVDA